MARSRIGIITAVVIVIAAAAGAYYGFWAPRQSQATQASVPPSQAHYETAQVKRASFTDTIQTTGSVRSNQTATLAWMTSGTISAVRVSKGQLVTAKTQLAALEPSTIPQTIILAQADLVNAQKALNTLLTSSQGRANAELALVKAQQALDDATKARRNLGYQRASQETIDIAQANLITANDALDKASKIFDRNRDRSDTDVVYAAALAQYAKARQNQIKAQYNYDYVKDLPDPLDVQEADAKVDVAQANLLQAKTDWERVKDGPNDQDVSAAQARVDAAQAAINLGYIVAPFSGTVTQAISKAGDQVTPGMVAFQVDDLSHLYVDMAVAEVDIARVKIGQTAALTLDALPGKTYQGKVTDIASVGKSTGSTVNFIVTVEISQSGQDIKPGMTVAASISVGQTKSALYVPSQAIRTRSGQQLIYMIKDGTPAPAVVLVGDSIDGGYSLIFNGAVKEGDTVITNLASVP